MKKPYTLHLGDCLETLRTLPDSSVDSIVCDPPYGLNKEPDMAEVLRHWLAGDDYQHKGGGFMGKTWDSFVPGPAIWKECLRVLKPGGYLLAFFGTRTQDIGTLAIRLAGFEIRDSIAWVYGSGFPKSLDVSKAIDKAAGRIGESVIELKRRLIELVEKSGKTRSQIDLECGFRATNYLTLPAEGKRYDPWVNCLPPREKWQRMKTVLGAGNDLDEVFTHAEREVIGVKKAAPGVAFSSDGPCELDITAPATEAARQWQGWGTALKPALEPITVARKPLAKGCTVAANVLAHGTGALNIDGCRIGFDSDADRASAKPGGKATAKSGALSGKVEYPGCDDYAPDTLNPDPADVDICTNCYHRAVDHRPRAEFKPKDNSTGRWPANLIHDGSEEVLAGFPYSKSGAVKAGTNGGHSKGREVYGDHAGYAMAAIEASEGSAARFFYAAKASRKDRNEGLKDPGPQFKRGTTLRQVENTDTKGNTHPTVKPTDLMAYLCRLVTPPGGVVLDPFMGSGSTGKAAMREGFRFIGCELSPEYLAIAEARISHECEKRNSCSAPEAAPEQVDLFAEAAE